MTLTPAENPLAFGPASPLSAAAIEDLASRFRDCGLCLLVMGANAALQFHDPHAAPFFAKYAVPSICTGSALGETCRQIAGDSGPRLHVSAPGVVASVCSIVEDHKIVGFVALLGRVDSSQIDQSTREACERLSLDPAWLEDQARQLVCHGSEDMCRHGALLAAMVGDQLRLRNAQQAAINLSEQLANSYEELSLIHQVSSGMRVNRRTSEFFRQTCQNVLEVMNVEAMGVALQHDACGRAAPVMYGPAAIPDAVVRRLAPQLVCLLQTRMSDLLINDVSLSVEFSWLGQYARQLLAVPLQRQDTVLGCLFVIDKQRGDFDSRDSKLLSSIANESAIYLENSILFADVHALMMGLMHSLTSAVDAKDAYTCGHSERVALLSRHLAVARGLPDGEVDQIYMAALLHDVGKIGVPEQVLQKTGRLTPEEFDVMKKHPAIGARILAEIKQMKPLIPGVLHHHERVDGKGYPAGLAGNDIPLMGRIICLADCFDAMTSSRTYRKALPLEVALSEIRRCAGTQFDASLAESFLRTGPSAFRELLRNHAEKSKKLLDLQDTLRAA
jgi:HD-GYP domain-containing protein (c-di-GMP phosphodiesterase class II)